MKLTNPTDDQLNAAFAEKVAGWFRAERMGKQVLYDPDGGHVLIGDARCMPAYTASADLVLPWLEKMGEFSQYYHKSFPDSERWSVGVDRRQPHGTGWAGYARASTFSRATTIALLRANGVDVEFTP